MASLSAGLTVPPPYVAGSPRAGWRRACSRTAATSRVRTTDEALPRLLGCPCLAGRGGAGGRRGGADDQAGTAGDELDEPGRGPLPHDSRPRPAGSRPGPGRAAAADHGEPARDCGDAVGVFAEGR